MKLIKNINLILFVPISLLFLGCNEDETQQVTTFERLVMADEFDVDGAPNPDMWTFDVGKGPLEDGWGNNELQYYTDRPENAVVQNGYLIITAKEEAMDGANYTSARLKTRNKIEQQYGRFEARIQLPTGKGLFPAFWMLGSNFCEAQTFTNGQVVCTEPSDILWPACGEIDIMEYKGNEPTTVFGTIHGPGFSGGESITKEYSLTNDRFDNSFHVFGMEWTADRINWYVDDVLYNSITREDVEDEGGEWVFDNSFYMLLNLAVGGNLPGSPNADTMFPQRMIVDYVRVYQ